jgi:integrase
VRWRPFNDRTSTPAPGLFAFNKLVRWPAAVEKIGVPGLHFHDLRHTGNTIAVRAGASTRELMSRMGHDSAQAAIIYQHATAEADRAIAQAVDKVLRADRKRTKEVAAKQAKKTRDPADDVVADGA